MNCLCNQNCHIIKIIKYRLIINIRYFHPRTGPKQRRSYRHLACSSFVGQYEARRFSVASNIAIRLEFTEAF